MENKFFGSKLNIVLIIVVIILAGVAINATVKNGSTVKIPENTIAREVLGNKSDLVSFSILPNSKVHGTVSYTGVIKGGYFFEGNILVNVLGANKNVLKRGNAMATGEWMTAGPVNFGGSVDFSGLQKGPAYIEIHNDNPSGLPEHDKSVLIPVVIE